MQRLALDNNIATSSEEKITVETKEAPHEPPYNLTEKQKLEDELLFELMPDLKKLLGERWAISIMRPLTCDEILEDLNELHRGLIVYHNALWGYSSKMAAWGGFGCLASLLLCCCAPPSVTPYIPALLGPSLGGACVGGVTSGNLPRAETYELISSTQRVVRNIKKHLTLTNGIDSQVSVTTRGLHAPVSVTIRGLQTPVSANTSNRPSEESVPLLRSAQ